MIGTVQPTGSDAPEGRGEGNHRQEEKGSRDLQPDDAAHPLEWTQKAAEAARDPSADLAGGASRGVCVCFLTRLCSVQYHRSGI